MRQFSALSFPFRRSATFPQPPILSRVPLQWLSTATATVTKTNSHTRESAPEADIPAKKRRPWTPEETKRLHELIQSYPGASVSWHTLAKAFSNRTRQDCYRKWHYCLNPDIKHGPWRPDEDRMLSLLVKNLGEHAWAQVAVSLATGRTPVQCRHRWRTVLRETVDVWLDKDDGEQQVLVSVKLRHGRWSWDELKRLTLGADRFPNLWETIATTHVLTRTAHQCRQRFVKLMAQERGHQERTVKS